jgi:hypothetical protein
VVAILKALRIKPEIPKHIDINKKLWEGLITYFPLTTI